MKPLLDSALPSDPTIANGTNLKLSRKSSKDIYAAAKVFLVLILLALLSSFFVIIHAGERGVLMQFGAVQNEVLGEGIHPIIPIVNTVATLSVRVQSQEISAEASSKDLQDVYTDVALNWHILPDETHLIFQQIGTQIEIVQSIINPAVEEVLKAVMAKYTAEEIITKRGQVKDGVDQALIERLHPYHLAVDDISLVHVRFSNRFRDAVEAKQVAEQDAKRAEFVALKAAKEAEAQVNLATGEAEAQRLLRENLTPELLQRQAIEKWNGTLPFIVGGEGTKLLDVNQLFEMNQRLNPSPQSQP